MLIGMLKEGILLFIIQNLETEDNSTNGQKNKINSSTMLQLIIENSLLDTTGKNFL